MNSKSQHESRPMKVGDAPVLKPTTLVQCQDDDDSAKRKLQRELLKIPILTLAKNHEYDEILFILHSPKLDIRRWLFLDYSNDNNSRQSFYLDVMNNFKGESILHQILKCHPPAEIIDLIIHRMVDHNQVDYFDYTNGLLAKKMSNVDYSPETEVDLQGKTPLHVAVTVGCSVDVIQRLLQGKHKSRPTCIRDNIMRLPLHWACSMSIESGSRTRMNCIFPTLTKRRRNPYANNYNLYKVIQLLVKVNPYSVLSTDKDGNKPIDIAKKSGMKREILEMLEKVENEQIQKNSNEVHRTTPGTSASVQTTTTKETTSHSSSVYLEFDRILSRNHEIITSPHDDNNDDISSVGSGGMSLYVRGFSKGITKSFSCEKLQI